MLNESFWKSVVENEEIRQAVPQQVRSFLEMSFAEIEALPVVTESWDGETLCRPRLDIAEITTSYLEFLEGEIRLRPKAANLYQERLNALKLHQGKNLYQLVLHRPKEKFCVVMMTEDLKIV